MSKFTPGEWLLWRLGPDSDPLERFIIVDDTLENEITGPISKPADAERIKIEHDFCAGFTNAQLDAFGSLEKVENKYKLLAEFPVHPRIMQAQIEQANSMMLEIRDESVRQRHLLRAIVDNWVWAEDDSQWLGDAVREARTYLEEHS